MALGGFSLKEGRFRLRYKKEIFTMTVVKYLPREVINAPSLETFKIRLGKSLSNLI